MNRVLTDIRLSALISTLLVLPFMLLEWINRREYPENYPVGLFILLWLLPAVFMYSLAAILRSVQSGNKTIRHRLARVLWLALAILMIGLWAGTVADQMPCFLGVPVCD